MVKQDHGATKSGFRHFFFRGLAILLPSILTIWILFVAYQFVQNRIAGPVNEGVRMAWSYAPWPPVMEDDIEAVRSRLAKEPGLDKQVLFDRPFLQRQARRDQIDRWWRAYAFPLDLIGLIIAILVIYMAGAFLGSMIGRRLYRRGEDMIAKVPLIKQVYPSVKQVTDFLVGGSDKKDKIKFSRVVAVEYPRKGIWSVGLVTGSTMRAIQEHMVQPCLTIFVPSSPTPFTGYTITVAAEDTIDLPVTIEQALRFTISGGVIVPPQQLIKEARSAASASSPAMPEQLSA